MQRNRVTYKITDDQLLITIIIVISLIILSFLAGFVIGRGCEKDISVEKKPDIEQTKTKKDAFAPDISDTKLTFINELDKPESLIEEYKQTQQKPKKTLKSVQPAHRNTSRKIKKGTKVYTIQVGSFKSEMDAKNLTEKLMLKGYETEYTVADLGSKGIYYRVNIGTFASRDLAIKYARNIKQSEPLVTDYLVKLR